LHGIEVERSRAHHGARTSIDELPVAANDPRPPLQTGIRMKPSRRLLAIALLSVPPTLWAAQAPPPTPVIVEQARTQAISDPLEALGTLRANESVEITAKVADVIAAIHFEDGEEVKAGQLLVQMSDAEEAALLLEAQSQADEAERQYTRLQTLVEQGNAPASQLDERRRDWESANARVKAVRSRLDDRVITAPFAGIVGLRQVSPGALVAPGTLITTLVDDSEMKLDFTMPAQYLGSVNRGTTIQASTPTFPGELFTGTVTSVDSVINPVTRSITVRARIPNSNHRLVPGMLMTLELQRGAREALVIGEEAIVPRGSSSFVYVVDPSAEQPLAEQREVRIGTRQPGRVEIVAGLQPGEMVVTHGTLKVRPGSAVRIRAVDDGTKPIAELISSSAQEADRG
jgi:membrane fusion protein, multidrug efflux system